VAQEVRIQLQSPIVRDSHETWPAQGDIVEVRRVTRTAILKRYFLLADEEPIQQLRIEFDVAGSPTEEFRDYEVRELEIETSPEEEIIFSGRGGASTSTRIPRGVSRRVFWRGS